MAAMVGGKYYHRRLDRGPEKADFYLLPEDDRRLISNLRYSMEGAREKITKLRDVLENKDKDVSREAALRRAAETKLQQLIDMYGDPAVMEELNDRLSHARRTDRRTRSTEELREVTRTEEGEVGGSRAFNRYWMNKRAVASGSDQVTTAHRSRSAERDTSTSRWHSQQRRRTSLEGDTDKDRGRHSHRSHSPSRLRSQPSVSSQPPEPPPPSEPSQSSLPTHPSQPPYHSQPVFPLPFNMSPPYPMYMPPSAFPYLPPQMHYMPQMQGSPDHADVEGCAMTCSTQGGQNSPNMGGQVAASSMTSSRTAMGLQMIPQKLKSVSFEGNTNSKTVATTTTACNPVNTSAVDNSSPRPEGSTASTIVPTRLHVLGTQQGLSGSREQNRQISLLLAELDAAKDLNVKMQERLMTTERELESLKITCKLRDAEMETVATSKAAALVEEIYTAQKVHDEAMIGRMRTANEDRDEAVMKLKHMDVGSDGKRRRKEKRYESGSDDYPGDKDIHRLLSQIDNADSSTKVNHHGERIVDTIKKNNQRRHRVTTEEMKAVLEERDTAVMKNRKLECELLRLQRQHHGRSPNNGYQEAAQAKLMATQQERDMAIGKLRKSQEELEKLQLYYNLHKSLSQEEHLRDEFNATLEAAEGELRQREAAVDQARRVNAQLTQQLKASVAAKMKMADEVAKAVQAQKGAEANNERLERLVNVLRRKINGLGSKSEDY